MRFVRVVGILVITAAISFTGCAKKDVNQKQSEQIKKSTIAEAEESQTSVIEIDAYFDSTSSEGSPSISKETRYIKEDELLARAILEELIKGADLTGNLKGILSKDTKIISVSIKDGIAYVSFDFNSNSENIIKDKNKEAVIVKAIVQSLMQIKSINSVKILIPATNQTTFGGTVDITKPLTPTDIQTVTIK
ncbi:GerMN domain-containing protein [Clostridium cellulovorans]|nr:GerMN domain-containing protein [Clostridium cellulovorans]